jgi:hypothetical protein
MRQRPEGSDEEGSGAGIIERVVKLPPLHGLPNSGIGVVAMPNRMPCSPQIVKVEVCSQGFWSATSPHEGKCEDTHR